MRLETYEAVDRRVMVPVAGIQYSKAYKKPWRHIVALINPTCIYGKTR